MYRVIDGIKKALSKRTTLPNGFMLVEDVKIARIGIQEYLASEFQPMAFNDRQPNDIVRVYRSPDVVFDAQAMESFRGAVMTSEHPAEMITPDNYYKYQVGQITGDIVRDGDFLVAKSITITASDAIQDVETGARAELSNGYYSGYDFNPGVSPQGESYDAAQINIVGNHLALTTRGRAGPSVRVTDTAKTTKPTTEEKHMRIKVNGIEFDVSDSALAQAIQAEQTANANAVATAQQATADAEAKLQTAEADKLKLQATVDAAPTAEARDADISAAAQELADTRLAAMVLAPTVDTNDKTADQLREEVVKKLYPNADMAKGPIYVSAMFDAAFAALDAKGLDKGAGYRQLAPAAGGEQYQTRDQGPADEKEDERMTGDQARQARLDRNRANRDQLRRGQRMRTNQDRNRQQR